MAPLFSFHQCLGFPDVLQKGAFAATAYAPHRSCSTNAYGVKASHRQWPADWTRGKQDKCGWFGWLIAYQMGRKSKDDDEQIQRWRDFGRRHGWGLLSGALKTGFPINDKQHWRRARQALLHWGFDSEHPRLYLGLCQDLIARLESTQVQRLIQLGFIPANLHVMDTSDVAHWLNHHMPQFQVPENRESLETLLHQHFSDKAVCALIRDIYTQKNPCT